MAGVNAAGGVAFGAVPYNPPGAGAVATTLKAKLGETPSTKDFGAVGDAASVTGAASITSGAAVLTLTGAAFTTADIGKTITGPFAAAGATLVTTIVGRTSATVVTLGANAGRTMAAVAGTTVVYGTDDRVALQAAIDYSALTGRVVRGIPSEVYLVGTSGASKTCYNEGGGNFTLPYCLLLKSGAKLQAVNLKLKPGADVALMLNEHPQSRTDTKMSLVGCDFDGSSVAITGTLVFLQNIFDCDIDGCVFHDTSCDAFYLSVSDNVRLGKTGRLEARNVAGQGLAIGGNTFYQCTNLDIGELYGLNCVTNPANIVSQPGNGIAIGAANWKARYLWEKGCEGKIKLQPNCANFDVDAVLVDGSAFNSVASGKSTSQLAGNSGFGLEGDNANNPIGPGRIGSIVSRGCGGFGLTVQWCHDVVIESYLGFSNGLSTVDGTEDFWNDIGSNVRMRYGDVVIDSPGGWGMTLVDRGVGTRIGDLSMRSFTCRNPGQITGAASASSLYAGVPCRLDIGHALFVDDQVTVTMGKAFDVQDATVAGIVHQCEIYGVAFTCDIRSPNLLLGPTRFHLTEPMGGVLTLTAGTTTTLVNGNIKVTAAGGGYFVEPIYDLVPLTAAAAAVKPVRSTHVSGTTTFTHPTAAGTEKFRWRFVGYQSATVRAT